MTEQLDEHVREVAKIRVVLKERFEYWLALSGEAEVIIEAITNRQQKMCGNASKRDVAAGDRSDKWTDAVRDNVLNLSQRNDSRSNHVVHDWNTIYASRCRKWMDPGVRKDKQGLAVFDDKG